MAKTKVTISLDRAKADRARQLVGATSTSAVLDLALDSLIQSERLRQDVAAYRRIPPTSAEIRIADLADTTALADATDWESLYSEEMA